MNTVVKWWRDSNPNDQRSDDEITLDLAGQYPDTFQTYPDALADFDRIRKDLLKSQLTKTDYVKQAVGSTIRGAADVVAGLPEATAILARMIGDKAESVGIPTGAEGKSVEDAATWKLGQGIRALGDKIAPEPVEGLEESFGATTVPQAVGSALGFIAGGGAGKKVVEGGVKAAATAALKSGASKGAVKALTRTAESVPIALLGSTTAGASAFKEAKNAGASDDEAYEVFLLNAGVGTSEILPLSRMLKRLDGVSGGAFTKTLIEAGKDSFEEGLQEAAQQFAGNFIAKKYYDEDRDLLTGVAEGSGAGAVTGALFSFLTQAIGAKVRRSDGVSEPDVKSSIPDKRQDKAGGVGGIPTQNAIEVSGNYLTDDDKALVDQLVSRVAAGEDMDEPEMLALGTQVGQRLQSAPAVARYYAEQIARIQSKSTEDKVRDQLEAAAATAAQSAEQFSAPAPAATEQDQSTGRSATDAPENAVDTTLPVTTPEANQAALATAQNPLLAAARQAAAAVNPLDEATPEPAVEEAVATPAPVVLPSPNVPPSETGNTGDSARTSPVVAIRPVTGPTTAWQKIEKPAGEILKLVENQKASVAKGEAGQGKKAARLFEVTADVDELYKDSHATGESKSHSRKLAVLQAPDDSHVLIGTAYQSPIGTKRSGEREAGMRRMISGYDAKGKVKALRLDDLLASGWKLVGSIKTDEPTKGFGATHSLQEWDRLRSELESLRGAQGRTAEAVQQTLREADTFRRGDEGPTGDDVADVIEVGATQLAETAAPVEEVKLKGFGPEEGKAIFSALEGKTLVDLDDLQDAIAGSKRAISAVGRMLKVLLTAGVTELEVSELALDLIYETHTKAGASKEQFADALLSGVRAEAVEATQSSGTPSAVAEGGAGPATREGGAQGTQAGADPNEQVAAAAAKTDTNPTEAQKKSGNYRKGTFTLEGLDIAIENPKGATRSGKDRGGNAWSVTMPAHYGYVKGTEGKDGDQVDVYIGDDVAAPRVWVVDQIDPQSKKFDEHKALLGFPSREAAIAAYIAGFSDGSGQSRVGEVTEMLKEDFADWVNEGNTEGPLSYGKKGAGKIVRHIKGKLRRVSEEELNAELAAEEGRVISGPGWITSSGQFVQADESPAVSMSDLDMGGHAKAALDWLQKNKPDVYAQLVTAANRGAMTDSMVYQAMFNLGFIRVAGDRSHLFIQGTPNRTQLALMKDSAIHNGATLTHDLPGGRSRTIYEPEVLERYSGTRPAVELRSAIAQFNSLMESLKALGVNVKLVRDAVGGFIREFGSYQESPGAGNRIVRAVTLSLADHVNPTVGNFMDALHEAVHLVYQNESPERQAAMDRAVSAVSDDVLGLSGHELSGRYSTDEAAAVLQEERLVEATTQKLVAQGFNPAESSGIAQALIRFIKDLWHRAAMAIQQGLLGSANAELTQKYFENRVKALLAGDQSYSFVSFLGGPKLQRYYQMPNSERAQTVVRFLDTRDRIVANENFERLPPQAQRILEESDFGAAATIAGAARRASEESFGQPKTRTERAELNRQTRMREELDLRTWAEQNGLMLDADEFKRGWMEYDPTGEELSGAEHKVYPVPTENRWRKANPANLHKNWAEYFERLALHNWMFPETAYRFEGFIDLNGELHAVVNQPHVTAERGATREEVAAEMGRMGFKRIKGEDYYSPALNVEIEDLHEGNALVLKDGRVAIIDPIPYMPDALDFSQGGYLEGEEHQPDVVTMRHRRESFVADPETPLSADVDGQALAQRDIAAQNAVNDTLKSLYQTWDSLGQNTTGLTFEQWLDSGNFANLPAAADAKTPADTIADINDRLTKTGAAAINPNGKLADVTNDSMRQRAAAVAHRTLQSLWAWMSTRRNAAEWSINPLNRGNLLDMLNRRNQEVVQLTKDYTNLEAMLALARTKIGSMLDTMRQRVGDVRNASKKAGVLEQVIKSIEGDINDPLMANYEKAINQLYTRLTKDPEVGRKFTDMLERIANLGIDWSDPVADIRFQLETVASTDKLLEPLTSATLPSKALMATVIAFGKSNANVMDALQLRRSTVLTERTTVNLALAKALEDHKDAITEARRMVKDLPRLGKLADRMLRRLEETKREHRRILDELQRERTFIDFHEDTNNVLRTELAKLEAVFGGRTGDFEPVHGAEYLVPPKPDAALGQVEASKKTLNLAGQTDAAAANRLSEDTRNDMRKMSAWLEAVPADQRGATWARVQQQLDKLAFTDIERGHEAIQSSWVNRLLAPLPDRLKFIGSPTARKAAERIQKLVFWQSSKARDAHRLGTKWDKAEGDAMQATGVGRQDVFRKLFHRDALSFIEKRQDLLAGQKDVEAATTLALKELKAYFQGNTATAALIAKPGAWSALERYYRATAAAASWLDASRTDMGLKIKDKSGDYEIFRESIGATPFTVMRGLSDSAQQVYQLMREAWTGKTRTKEELQASYDADPAAMKAGSATLYTPEVWQKFVRPLAHRTGRSVFQALDGTTLALREDVIQAFESSQDPVTFAENLYTLQGGSGSPGAYVAETIETLQSFFKVLESQYAEREHLKSLGLPMPPHYLMDSRKSEEFPAEWLDYQTYGIHDLRQISKMQALQSAFGRDLNGWRADINKATQEQRDLAKRYVAMQEAHPDKSGKALKEAVRADAKAQGINPLLLEQAGRNAQMLAQVNQQINAYLTLNKDRPIEIEPWAEILGTIAGLAVSGPATAFTDTISVFEQPFRKFGFSTEALKHIGGSVKSLAGQTYGSLLQAVGKQSGFEAKYTKLLRELGYFDDDATLTLKDKMAGLAGEQVATGSPIMRGVVKGARAVRAAMSTGVGRAPENAEAVFPTVKPHSVFTYQSQLIHAAEIIAWWKQYEALTAAAVQHFEANPGDARNPKFKFAPAQLGHREGRAWDYLLNSMANYGLSLEEVARQAYDRRQANPRASLLTRDQYRALAMQGQNEITLESNLATRLPFLQTSPLGNLMNPMLGWAVEKGYDAWRGFREADGQKSMRGFRQGMLAYAAILPIAMAYALMRDEYDEEILGKKANVRDLTTITGPADAFSTMLDNAARVGTFGLFGEVGNKLVNYDTQRDISLDNRIFFVSSLLGFQNALTTWARQGTADWATVGRPLSQSLGGTGFLQYADAINNALSLDNQEARVTKRISVSNYLRTTGRELGLDVRTSRGMQSLPNSIKPYVGQMVLAAYANDAQAFQEAYRNAKAAAREEGKPDPEDHVKRSFGSYHPLRMTFRTEPSEAEYRRILGNLSDEGRAAVAEAIRLYNFYGQQLGISPNTGKKDEKKPGVTLNLGGNKPVTLTDVRRLAAGVGAPEF